jgi:hypothetical protein
VTPVGDGPGPNFFIIGAARCGTSAIALAIADHPQGFVTAPKEPHFLAFTPDRPKFAGPNDEANLNRVAVTDLDRYLELYEGAAGAVARGDGSVTTLYYAPSAVPALERHFPDAKLIVSLRDPVERAYSAYQYLRSRRVEPLEDFEAALDAEPDRIASRWQHMWHYEAMGHYAAQLAPFVETFGRDRLLVVSQDDLTSDFAGVIAQLDRFLGLEPRAAQPSAAQVNVGGSHRWPVVGALTSMVERSTAVKGAIRAVVPQRLRERVRAGVLRSEAIPRHARDRLTERFAGEQLLVEEILRG